MPRLQYSTDRKLARTLLQQTGFLVMLWDSEWHEFAAFAPEGSELTSQNMRGAVKRIMRANNYAVDILEDDLRHHYPFKTAAISFRFAKLTIEQMPKQKPIVLRELTPPQPTEQLPMKLT